MPTDLNQCRKKKVERKPKISEASELRAYSKEHIAYELSLLIALCELKETGIWAMDMAIYECRILHFRSILEFLDNHYPKDDDVIVEDYLQQGERLSPLDQDLDTARKRSNKEIAHLTAERIGGFQVYKVWDFANIFQRLSKVLKDFSVKANKELLDDSVFQLIDVFYQRFQQ